MILKTTAIGAVILGSLFLAADGVHRSAFGGWIRNEGFHESSPNILVWLAIAGLFAVGLAFFISVYFNEPGADSLAPFEEWKAEQAKKRRHQGKPFSFIFSFTVPYLKCVASLMTQEVTPPTPGVTAEEKLAQLRAEVEQAKLEKELKGIRTEPVQQTPPPSPSKEELRRALIADLSQVDISEADLLKTTKTPLEEQRIKTMCADRRQQIYEKLSRAI